MKVIVIIPAFNEGKNLLKLLTEIRQLCVQYDIVVINDCSSDETAEICRKYDIDFIDLPINLGIGGAVQCGYKYAFYNNYDIAVQVDGDGQHKPQYIDMLVGRVVNGSNLCIGSRFIKKEGFQSTIIRRTGIKFLSGLIKIVCKQLVTDPTSGFRACDRKAIEFFTKFYPQDYPEPETNVALLRNNLIINEVPVTMSIRESGKSSITIYRSIYYMIKVSLAIIITLLSRRV